MNTDGDAVDCNLEWNGEQLCIHRFRWLNATSKIMETNAMHHLIAQFFLVFNALVVGIW